MPENTPDSASPGSSSDNPWASPTSDSPQDAPATQPMPQPPAYGQPSYGQPAPTVEPSQPDFGPAPAYGAPPSAPTFGAPPAPPAYGAPPAVPASGQQPGYPQPYPMAPGAPVASSANTVKVLGIVSLVLTVCCGVGFIPAIVTLVMAGNARREVLASGGALSGLDHIKTGKICSWIAIGLTVVAILVLGLLVIIGLAAAPSDRYDSSY